MAFSIVWKVVFPVIVAVGCGGGGSGSPAPATPPAPVPGSMNLAALVENQNDFPAVIYAYRGGRWTRLGLVEADRTRRLRFTWDRAEVRFVIELQGNDDLTDIRAEEDMRKTFAADVHGTVPCHLTARTAVEANLTLMLTVDRGLAKNRGAGRCQRRAGN
ncbi:MAG: hypothetical protein O7I93_01920 [Gemmatimonadetes bacterium]|nr:hypothetical protein [Gemmatimonadota bacterium]